MKIDSNRPVNSTSGTKKAKSSGAAGGTAFESLLNAAQSGGQAAAASGTSSGNTVSSIDSVLALQQVSDEASRQAAVVREGNNMLDSLENLRRSLLMGQIPASVMMELGDRLARQRTQTADPKLHAIMDDIELRVAVEKAKLERALREKAASGEGSGTLT